MSERCECGRRCVSPRPLAAPMTTTERARKPRCGYCGGPLIDGECPDARSHEDETRQDDDQESHMDDLGYEPGDQ